MTEQASFDEPVPWAAVDLFHMTGGKHPLARGQQFTSSALERIATQLGSP